MPRTKKQINTETAREHTREEKREAMRRALYESAQFDQTYDLDEWADRFRILPQETSSEHGAWSTARFPFLKRIMKCLSPSSIAQEIICMKGAQLGLTETGINWLLYSADCHPGPTMYVQTTDDSAKDFSVQKLKPSIRDCDRVLHTLGEDKPKHYANSWDNKAYPGGFIVLGGSNSSAFLRSKSIRDCILDEEDTYELNISNEGSPVRLVAKRQQNFPDRKRFRLSTPVLAELSTIEPAWEGGSQERYYVPCPHCNEHADEDGFMFWIRWKHIKWEGEKDGRPERYWLECPNCGSEINEDQHKGWMLTHGDWYSEKDSDFRYKVGDVLNPSFHISSLYSPPGFFSWGDAIAEWLEYKRTRDVALLQVFINQTLAETYSAEGKEINYSVLIHRREDYGHEVPLGALVLTAGVDIQDDRIEAETVGWGLLEESWSIDYAVFPGDTSNMGDRYGMLSDGRPSVWRLLDEYLMKRWKHESGIEVFIEMAMIDSGYKTEEAHIFCRLREGRRVFPVKGSAGWGKGLWSVQRRRHERYGTVPYTAHVDEVKNKIYSMLMLDQRGPGYCHFPRDEKYGEKYFKGLTCETRKVKQVSGRKVLYWDTPPGARNEPLDCRGYAYVAHLAYPVDLEARARLGMEKAMGPQSVGRKPRVRRRRGSPGL